MSQLLWCDVHDGTFSDKGEGWAHMTISVRQANGQVEPHSMHACKECTDRVMGKNPVEEPKALTAPTDKDYEEYLAWRRAVLHQAETVGEEQ